MTPAELEIHILKELLPELAPKLALGKIPRKDLEPFCEEILRIAEAYNSRSAIKVNARQALAYALYYLPINFQKVVRYLSYLPLDMKVDSVLDFGCGPGTASLAACSKYKEIQCLAYDSSLEMTKVAKTLLAQFNCSVVCTLPNQTFDLIIAANSLNEIQDKVLYETTLQRLYDGLNPNGALLVIEPALQTTTRALMNMRDRLLLRFPDLVPVFPCTHKNYCPMLQASEQDWCHDTISWERPPLVKQIDEIVGFNKHRIKVSGIIFRKNGQVTGGTRIVSDVKKTKAGFEFLACSAERYGMTTTTKSELKSLNLSKHDLVNYLKVS